MLFPRPSEHDFSRSQHASSTVHLQCDLGDGTTVLKGLDPDLSQAGSGIRQNDAAHCLPGSTQARRYYTFATNSNVSWFMLTKDH